MKIYNGNCLEIMKNIKSRSVALILTDLPYGTTDCKWDSVIDMGELWAEYKRVLRPTGSVCLFGSEPFSTMLRQSNMDWYKYDWYWIKSNATGMQHAKNRPMRKVETISVFSPSPMGHASLLGSRRMTYNPQGLTPVGIKTVKAIPDGQYFGPRPNQVGKEYLAYTGYPTNVLQFKAEQGYHPTQKPVPLLEYLIRTYTNTITDRDGDTVVLDTVLDSTMGSGSTGVACVNTDRDFIGIELTEKYFKIAKERIQDAIYRRAETA